MLSNHLSQAIGLVPLSQKLLSVKKLILVLSILLPSISNSANDQIVRDSKGGVAILLIDAFLVEGQDWAPNNLAYELEIMSAVLQKANEANVPVFEFHIQNGAITNPKLLALKTETNWVSTAKNSHSVFADPQIHEALVKAKIKTLIVMGFNQKLCVRASVADAVSLGYRVYTSFDVIQGHRIESDELVRGFYRENTFLYPGISLIDVFLKK